MFCTTALPIDLDGTLVETGRSVERSWRSATSELGLPFSAVSGLIHGVPAREAAARAYPQLRREAVTDLAERAQAAQAGPEAVVTLMPGAREFLARIPVDRWAVVTSGDHRLASASIGKAGVPIPLSLVTADDVRNGEPAPDPFLTAARALRIPEPSMCVAVEDSPAGIESRRARRGCACWRWRPRSVPPCCAPRTESCRTCGRSE